MRPETYPLIHHPLQRAAAEALPVPTPGETYTLSFEVRLANGETLPLAFGAFTF